MARHHLTSKDPKVQVLFMPILLQKLMLHMKKQWNWIQKAELKKKIITGSIYNSLAVNLYNQGSARFEAKDYAGALKSFETQIKITESDIYAGAIDTGMYYNAGLAAVNSAKYDEAIKYFEKCAEMKYLGVTPYFQMSEAYMIMGDTAKAEATLQGLSSKFPNDKNVTLQLIDLYIKSGKNEEAIKYIKLQKKLIRVITVCILQQELSI